MSRTDDELRSMLTDLESDQVERKESLSSSTRDRVNQAICAFANDLPDYGTSGVVFIGATDDGRVGGMTITDQLLLDLAGMRDRGQILPLPEMVVRKLAVEDAHVAVVEVQPSPSPPIRFDGRVWIRVGPRRAVASADEERRLSERRRAGDLAFDARPQPGSSLGDLDLALFEREYLPAALPQDVLDANERTALERLAALRLATSDGIPTAAGLLVLGNDPTPHLPGAYVQFLRVDGDSLAAPITDEKSVGGPLPDVLRRLDELLALNIHTAVMIGAASREERRPDYPLAALQQITRNALLHRSYEGTNAPTRITWYADRVEIYSPGGPYGAVTVENFGMPGATDYRNPVLAEAMRSLGYVQRFGAGIPIARRALAEGGNPMPEFTADPAYVGVILRGAV